MRARTLALAAAVAAVLPAPAAAKELVRATICGASACTTITDRATLRQIPGGEATAMLGPMKPYYTVELVNEEPGGTEHSFTMYYVPAADGMAWEENGVVRLHPIFGEPTITLMRRLVRRLEPFPAPRITSARVGGRRVTGREARTYGRLFAEKRDVDLVDVPEDWVEIDLAATRPSPWTDSRVDLLYSPSPPPERSRDFPWLVLVLGAAGAVGLASIHTRRR